MPRPLGSELRDELMAAEVRKRELGAALAEGQEARVPAHEQRLGREAIRAVRVRAD